MSGMGGNGWSRSHLCRADVPLRVSSVPRSTLLRWRWLTPLAYTCGPIHSYFQSDFRFYILGPNLSLTPPFLPPPQLKWSESG